MAVDESSLFRDAAPLRFFDRHARKLIARIQKNHGDSEAVEALAAHYAKRGDNASLANLMEGYGKALSAAAAAAEAYVRAADAALLSGDRERAEALYERALMRDPSHAEALDRALRVADDGHDVEGMRRILSAVLSAAKARRAEPKLLASLHFRLAEVYEVHFQDLDQATALYRSAIDLQPQFAKAMAAARRLYQRAGNHSAVSVLYEIDIDVAKSVDDKRALLLALAEHKRQRCLDLNGALDALQRACALEPADATAFRKFADALIARSDSSSGANRERDRGQAADVLYQLARTVQRAEAAAPLAEALKLVPEHARASALLHELRGHAVEQADGNAELGDAPKKSPHGDESQLVLDQRSTLRMFIAPETQMARAKPTAQAGATQALSTRDLLPIRAEPPPTPVPAPEESGAHALSTADLLPVRSEPPKFVPAQTARPRFSGEMIPLRSEPPKLEDVAAPTPVPSSPEAASVRAPKQEPTPIPTPAPRRAPANRTSALTTGELIPLTLPPPVPDTVGRARIVEQLEHDPTRHTLDVQLGVATESNLYVNVDNRLIDGGVFVASYQAPAAGTAVTLHIELPGGLRAMAHGQICMRRDSLDPFAGPIPGAYVAFEALTQQTLALLGRFAAKRMPLLYDHDD